MVSLLMIILEPKQRVRKRNERDNAEDLNNETTVCTQVAVCVAEAITEHAYSSVEGLYGALRPLSIGEVRGAMQIEHYKRAQELPVWRQSRIVFGVV